MEDSTFNRAIDFELRRRLVGVVDVILPVMIITVTLAYPESSYVGKIRVFGTGGRRKSV